MAENYPSQPDWSKRLPGEQWLMLDSIDSAEAYLATYASQQVSVVREEYPNPQGLYARIRFPDRIAEHRVYIASAPD